MSRPLQSTFFFFIFLFLAIGLYFLFNFQLVEAESNKYIGYRKINIDLAFICVFIVSCFLLFPFIPGRFRQPSDFFVFLYFVFVIFPYLIFYGIRGGYNYDHYILQFLFVVFPIVPILAISILFKKLIVRFPVFLDSEHVVLFVSLLSLAAIGFLLLNPTPSAGFDLESSYVRRLEGRDIYTVRSALAYLSSATMNGFIPFLAFYSAWKLRLFLFVFSVICWMVFFYLFGVKAPLLFILVSTVIGYSVRINKVRYLFVCIGVLLALSVAFSLVEFFISGYSYIADYFIRRAFTVPPFLVSAYFDFMFNSPSFEWNMLTGFSSVNSISFVIGEQFLGMPGLNANTNAFIYSLAEGGFFKYTTTVLLVSVVFSLLDIVFRSSRNPMLIYVGFLYAILITEQAATTALVSSGVAVITVLVIFAKTEVIKMVKV